MNEVGRFLKSAQVDLKPKITDVSEIVHDGKKNEFRVYEDESNPQHAMVKRTYYNMHTNQTVDFVRSKVGNPVARDCE